MNLPPRMQQPPRSACIFSKNLNPVHGNVQVRQKLRALKLDNGPVYEREKKRKASPDHAKAPWFINFAYLRWIVVPLLSYASFARRSLYTPWQMNS